MSQKRYLREDSIIVQQPLIKEQFAYHESCLRTMRAPVCVCMSTSTCVCLCIKHALRQSQQKRQCLVILICCWRNHYLFLILQCFSVILYVWFTTIKFLSPWGAYRCRNYFYHWFHLLMNTYFKFTLQTSSLHLPCMLCLITEDKSLRLSCVMPLFHLSRVSCC